jgi:hypothetical protein
MGFIINKHPDAVANFEWKDGQEPKTMDVEPGLIGELLPGQEFQQFDPTHPSSQYEMFTSTVLLAIARGLRVSYLTLTGDPKRANFSSMRAAFEPERYRWRCLQVWMSTHCNRIVFRDWIDMATLKGALDVPSRIGSDYYAAQFKGRGWKYVDPLRTWTPPRKKCAWASTAFVASPPNRAATTKRSSTSGRTTRNTPTSKALRCSPMSQRSPAPLLRLPRSTHRMAATTSKPIGTATATGRTPSPISADWWPL